jgi:hypothetical protein
MRANSAVGRGSGWYRHHFGLLVLFTLQLKWAFTAIGLACNRVLIKFPHPRAGLPKVVRERLAIALVKTADQYLFGPSHKLHFLQGRRPVVMLFAPSRVARSTPLFMNNPIIIARGYLGGASPVRNFGIKVRCLMRDLTVALGINIVDRWQVEMGRTTPNPVNTWRFLGSVVTFLGLPRFRFVLGWRCGRLDYATG